MTTGCGPQLASCAADCACKDALAGAADCINGGGDDADCLSRETGTGDPLGALQLCFEESDEECCSTAPQSGRALSLGDDGVDRLHGGPEP
jgi:hypothetical protein